MRGVRGDEVELRLARGEGGELVAGDLEVRGDETEVAVRERGVVGVGERFHAEGANLATACDALGGKTRGRCARRRDGTRRGARRETLAGWGTWNRALVSDRREPMPMTPIQPSGRTASGGHEGAKRSTPLGVPDAIATRNARRDATRARGRERRRAEPRARWTFTDRDATRDDIPRRALCAHEAERAEARKRARDDVELTMFGAVRGCATPNNSTLPVRSSSSRSNRGVR